ncbi:hypothetical protein [Steroidobacter denitrificans]|uniref:hypothetical protein n=1 Tax=Steroidobacter denitrificans TaxID=465721 RepID=UPI001AEFAB75|nr:hypothetical protein [Steroidobacter denitrificans]
MILRRPCIPGKCMAGAGSWADLFHHLTRRTQKRIGVCCDTDRTLILANLYRWRKQGVWGPAYEEWQEIARCDDDGALFAAMLGHDEDANRLRQSMPFVDLLSQDEVKRLHEEAAA